MHATTPAPSESRPTPKPAPVPTDPTADTKTQASSADLLSVKTVIQSLQQVGINCSTLKMPFFCEKKSEILHRLQTLMSVHNLQGFCVRYFYSIYVLVTGSTPFESI